VRSYTLKQSNTTYALTETSSTALKALQQFSIVNTLKNAFLKAERKPSLLI
jgi:hypothetical protein